jgi:hypothetical protein
MYDPLMIKALALDRERDMNRRVELARQLREVKAERKLQRRRRISDWASSLLRYVREQDSAVQTVVTCDSAREANP